jgi:hypothetical protein
LPGSLDLIAHLLETLSKIVQTLPQTQADISYIEQLLMSAVESAASKINVCGFFDSLMIDEADVVMSRRCPICHPALYVWIFLLR